MKRSARCAYVVAVWWLLGCASGPTPAKTVELTPARLYPMAPGSAWSYDVDAGDGTAVLAITRVTSAGEGRAVVQGGEGATHYELRPDGIFRADRGGYLLKAPLRTGATWSSGGGLTAEIAAMDAAIETPAGAFRGCVEVVERGAPTGAVISTVYCPEVGPVQVVSTLVLSSGEVRVVARLRGYQIGDGSAPTGPGSAPTGPGSAPRSDESPSPSQ
jgi:hypothetical protein